MKVQLRSRKINGAGNIVGTVAVYGDGNDLLFEDVVNLSKERDRDKLIIEVADRAKVSKDRARTSIFEIMETNRAALVEEADAADGGRERKADRLVRLVIDSGTDLFHDQYRDAHAAVPEDGRRAIYRLRSRDFKLWLAHQSFNELGEVPATEILNASLNALSGTALFDGPEHRLYVRTAWRDDAIWYDLGKGRAVKVTSAGWEVVERPPILFRSSPHQQVQVTPQWGGALGDVLPLINIEDKADQLLYLAHIPASMVPDIPRAITVFLGPQGSAKSTGLRVLRELLDPVEIPLVGVPKNADEFVRMASKNLCVFLDNVSSLPSWLSDGLSRLCTGDGLIKRALYTDDDDSIHKAKGVGGITCIDLVITAPDMLDRSLLFHVARIPDDERLEERGLDARFAELKPKLLGAIFDVLSKAMKIRPTIQPQRLPRLADYAVWGCAAAVAMGYESEDYWAAFEANVTRQTTEALDASVVAQAVRELMKDRTEWQGTPSTLLVELNNVADGLGIDVKSKAWPKDPRWVTRRLNLVEPNLAQVGIDFTSTSDGNVRRIALRCRGNDVNDVLHVSGQLSLKDIKDDTDIISADLGRNASENAEDRDRGVL